MSLTKNVLWPGITPRSPRRTLASCSPPIRRRRINTASLRIDTAFVGSRRKPHAQVSIRQTGKEFMGNFAWRERLKQLNCAFGEILCYMCRRTGQFYVPAVIKRGVSANFLRYCRVSKSKSGDDHSHWERTGFGCSFELNNILVLTAFRCWLLYARRLLRNYPVSSSTRLSPTIL